MSCHIPLEELRALQRRREELVVGAEETQAREATDLAAEGGDQ
jgi:hypothetical protein